MDATRAVATPSYGDDVACHIPKQPRRLKLRFVELAILLEQKDCLPIDKQLLSIPSEHLAY